MYCGFSSLDDNMSEENKVIGRNGQGTRGEGQPGSNAPPAEPLPAPSPSTMQPIQKGESIKVSGGLEPLPSPSHGTMRPICHMANGSQNIRTLEGSAPKTEANRGKKSENK